MIFYVTKSESDPNTTKSGVHQTEIWKIAFRNVYLKFSGYMIIFYYEFEPLLTEKSENKFAGVVFKFFLNKISTLNPTKGGVPWTPLFAILIFCAKNK